MAGVAAATEGLGGRERPAQQSRGVQKKGGDASEGAAPPPPSHLLVHICPRRQVFHAGDLGIPPPRWYIPAGLPDG